jgi:hypothetical protein
MKSPGIRSSFRNRLCYLPVAMACVALLLSPSTTALAQQTESPVLTTTTPSTADAPPIPKEQLDSLVAPIALYPDGLLGQTLVASTYPLEIIQLQQWMDQNKNLKDKALADAVGKQGWDPSIQAMSAFPEVTQRLAGNIQWTTDLGNAFLAQQADVMDAVQRMRAKARSNGALESSTQQRVETRVVEGGEEVIVVDPANPQVVYVPSYDPTVVYGEPVYPYPPYYYPGYVPGMGLTFGTGLILGAAWGGNWGWGPGWGNGDINVDWNNNHVSHYNRQNNINRVQGGDKWQHRPEHRGNTPYGNKQTENKYGNIARNPSGRQTGAGPETRPLSRNVSGNRPGGGTRPHTMPANHRSNSGGDPIGGRNVSPGSGFGSSDNAFGGGGFGGGPAHSASNRGGHSMGGGGFHGGGGGRGGGRRR